MEVHLKFKGEGPNLSFVEAETYDGRPVSIGAWMRSDDGYATLVVDLMECSICSDVSFGRFEGYPYCEYHYSRLDR